MKEKAKSQASGDGKTVMGENRKRTATAAATARNHCYTAAVVVDCSRHANVMLMIYDAHMILVARQQLINIL